MDNDLFENYAELVAKFKSGDESAYEELYTKTQRMVYSICLGILRNEDDAFDAMQDTYLTVYRKIGSLEDDKTFISWLKRIATPKSLDLYKKRKGDVSYDDAVAADESLQLDDDLESLPDSYIMEKTKREALDKIIKDSLSDVQYQTIHMHYYSELPVETIAELMNCPVGTVKTRLMTSRAKIKEGVKKYEKDNKDAFAGAPAVPFLTRFFNANSDNLKVPNINISTLIGEQASNVAPTIADAVTQLASNEQVKDVAKGGFLTTTAAKIIVGTLAVAVPTAAALGIKSYVDKNQVIEETVPAVIETTVEPTATPTPIPTNTPTPTPIPTIELSASEYYTDYPIINNIHVYWSEGSGVAEECVLDDLGYSVYVHRIEGTDISTSGFIDWLTNDITDPNEEYNLSFDEYYSLYGSDLHIEPNNGIVDSYGYSYSGSISVEMFNDDRYYYITYQSETGELYLEDGDGNVNPYELVCVSENGHRIYRCSAYNLRYISPIDDTYYISWSFTGGNDDTYHEDYIDDMDYVVVEDGYEVEVVP